MTTLEFAPPPVVKLSRDMLRASRLLTTTEVRYLVDMYYSLQDYRIQAAGQIRASADSGEPHELLTWQLDQFEAYENSLKAALDHFTNVEPTGMGLWAKGIYGIGPVISAGLLAHVNIERLPSASHLWSFAGLNPDKTWEKGQKRPWNARLKTLCWKIGQSFMKFSGRDDCYYGKLYQQRKAYEVANNEAGKYAERAALALSVKRFGDDTKAKSIYVTGKLPPAHLDARARRWTVKLFLAHYWEVWYERHHGVKPPAPYPIQFLGHVDYLPPPTVDSTVPVLYP